MRQRDIGCIRVAQKLRIMKIGWSHFFIFSYFYEVGMEFLPKNAAGRTISPVKDRSSVSMESNETSAQSVDCIFRRFV